MMIPQKEVITITHNPEQNIAVGNWLLDLADVERERNSISGQVAALAVGTGAFALTAWAIHRAFGPQARIIH